VTVDPASTFDGIADRLIDWSIGEERVRALWVEGDSLEEVRRPYRKLRIHLAADEPAFPALVASLPVALEAAAGAKVLRIGETARLAKELALRAGSLELTLIAEQTNLLAKRPRAEVAPLVDKTGHLTHVMDFSRRRRGGA
jgi:hypothetical protein